MLLGRRIGSLSLGLVEVEVEGQGVRRGRAWVGVEAHFLMASGVEGGDRFPMALVVGAGHLSAVMGEVVERLIVEEEVVVEHLTKVKEVEGVHLNEAMVVAVAVHCLSMEEGVHLSEVMVVVVMVHCLSMEEGVWAESMREVKVVDSTVHLMDLTEFLEVTVEEERLKAEQNELEEMAYFLGGEAVVLVLDLELGVDHQSFFLP